MRPPPPVRQIAEFERLRQVREEGVGWRKWGPYLSERQWATVREDDSKDGNPWGSFTHDQARSRAYRWGEDGIAGFCDEKMRLCFALALWNGRDRILKERLFGLANGEGNHGEDVKEYYFYLDGLPTHSYMRMLYKYPQGEYPYSDLVHVNRERSRLDFEYELLDTHVFDKDRYFDVFVEYAKESTEEIFIRLTIANRCGEPARLHVLPHLWFRNTWWRHGEPEPVLSQWKGQDGGACAIMAEHADLGVRYLQLEGSPALLFTCNETNTERLFDRPNKSRYVKDGINDYVVDGQSDAIDPLCRGTKAAAQYVLNFKGRETRSFRLRLGETVSANTAGAFAGFDALFTQRQREADEYYESLTPASLSADQKNIVRQGFAGMFWSKQTYIYDVSVWLAERKAATTPDNCSRNHEWSHLAGSDVLSMPDKWEYPWFAAWDLAFQTLVFAVADPDFASEQLELLLRERYAHPNGQIPASEWNFGDVNPPVHAWATIFMYRLQRLCIGSRALDNLRRQFHRLLLNFTWWVNRKDRNGRTVFQGGFLGLNNVGLFDRNAPLPAGGFLDQADGTAWMALYSQNMLEIAIELALHDPSYEELAVKFYEQFVWVAAAMDHIGERNNEMWDEKDGFFYDVLQFPGAGGARLKVRSMVGLIPLCAVTVFPGDAFEKLPYFAERVRWFHNERPDLVANIGSPVRSGVAGRRLLSVLDERKLRRVLARVLDPEEFLSEYGIRSLSRYHRDHPYVFRVGADDYQVAYRPAESDSGLFGGNSNWRGPVWVPVNVLLIRALLHLYSYYGESFRVECPTGSSNVLTLFEVAAELTRRLTAIFTRDSQGRRPVYGGTQRFQDDPYWRDLILFHEYFHGDNGAGIGASHKTGWTGLIPMLMCMFGELTAEEARRDLGFVFKRVAERTGRGASVQSLRAR